MMRSLTIDYAQFICVPAAAGIIAYATEASFWLILLGLFVSKIKFSIKYPV